MKWRKRMAEGGVTPPEFFSTILPAIHKERGADEYGDFCDEPIVVSFLVEGEGGGRWSVRFQDGDLDIENGELDEDPVVTLAGHIQDWPIMCARLVAWVNELENFFDDNRGARMRSRDFALLRQFKGTVDMKVTGFSDESGTRDLCSTLYLNAYEKSAGRSFSVSVSADDYQKILDGDLKPARAFADGQINLDGDVALAMQIATFAMRFKR